MEAHRQLMPEPQLRAAANIRRDGQTYPQRIPKVQTGYAEYKKMRTTPENALKLYTNYVDPNADQIMAVEGLATATTHKGKGKWRRQEECQQQVMVQWRETLVPHWAMQLYAPMGYNIQSAHLASQQDKATYNFTRPGECCWDDIRPIQYEPKETYESDILQCTLCHRVCHQTCIRTARRTRQQRQYTDGQCWECWRSPPTEGDKEMLGIMKVKLHSCPETIDTVKATGTTEVISALETLLQAPVTQRPPSPPKQAIPQSNQDRANERLYDISLGDSIRHRIHIHPTPINPHVDIQPQGKCTITIRPVEGTNLPITPK